jgi:transcriptional regulator with XRE-family HTH domain
MLDPGTAGTAGRDQQPRPLLRKIIGDALRRARLEQRRTLADVARAARVSMAYLSEVERGRKEASSEILAAICDALRIGLSDLLADAGRDLELRDRRARRDRTIRLGLMGSPAERSEHARGHVVPLDTSRDSSAQGSGPASAQALLAA